MSNASNLDQKETQLLAVIHTRRNHSVRVELARAVVAWHADGAVETRLFVHEDSSNASHYGAGLNAFALLLEISDAASEPILLHINENTLRKEISAVVDAFPSVTIVGVARGAVLDLTRAALELLDADSRERQAAREEREAAREELERELIAALPELTVATDASKSHRRGVGVACVSEDGVRYQRMVPNVTTILEGELLAIELAIARFPDRRLHILTDSRASLQHLGVLQAPRPLCAGGGVKAAVDRIQESMRGREIRLSWVRGHSGHLLNETADRLALAVRRAHESGIPTETGQAIAQRIVEPLLGAA
ncbi:RNase H family protein [Rhodococcus marinonascens]|uniref:RNase H family protein n=1 Tax=Rhodococcus marinonascens TaxID=38311 RepID=UPI0009355E73|nr:RNase H family protein [Rhodococcus marinonascens]